MIQILSVMQLLLLLVTLFVHAILLSVLHALGPLVYLMHVS